METIKKYRALVSIIVFLLITNMAMLIFFMVLSKPIANRHRSHDQNGMYTTLQKDVGFSKAQLDQYQVLRNQQRDTVKPLFNDLRKAKETFYGLIYSSDVSDSLLNSDVDLIAQKQKELDLKMFNHFKNVRNLCTPDQLQKFDSTIKKVVTRMIERPGKGRPDKK
jgi:Spy/CpxP family protein refolding chaperone